MNYLKKFFSNKNNIITLVVVAFILFRQLPSWLNNFQWEGKEIETQSYQPLAPQMDEAIDFPSSNKRTLAIFWASWCGPCKVEMSRLKNSVDEGKIKGEQIFAINPFEQGPVVKKFIEENQFPFIFIEAPEVAQKLNISMTPTTVLMDKTEIKSITSGISFVGIWRAEFFLK
ncbi:MAG: TlpA disulfide reductase family protein [Candidatus Caldatribacteriota bacterium]